MMREFRDSVYFGTIMGAIVGIGFIVGFIGGSAV